MEYSYDSLYRLTSETITEGEKVTVYTYAYDNVSNRILKTENGAETAYVYNALNQLVSDSKTTYEYDLNGNLIRVIGSAQSALYEYNAENKLVRATVQNGVLVTEETYTYDYSGNRTSKTTHRSDGVTEYVKYLNDNSSLTNVLVEIGSEGSVQAYYTIGADLISQERDGKVSVYLYDGHGSVVGLANESGVITDTYCYDAFGNLLKSKGSTKNCYRYCGEQFDETTGLYYLRARYMDTTTGRFISQDSYQGSINGPVSLHKYLYANANPVTYSDPSGYMSVGEAMVVSAIQGALMSTACTIGMNILKNLDETGEFKITCSAGEIVFSAVFGGLFGLIFSVLVVYAIEIALIILAIGIASSIVESLEAFANGDSYQGCGYAFLSLLGLSGMKKLSNIYLNNGQVPICRWGRPGLEYGDWVMYGKKGLKSFLFSFKWDPNPTNSKVGFTQYSSTGESAWANVNDLTWPQEKGIDSGWKWIFGQRQYFPGASNYDYSAEYPIVAYLIELIFGSDN